MERTVEKQPPVSGSRSVGPEERALWKKTAVATLVRLRRMKERINEIHRPDQETFKLELQEGDKNTQLML